MPNRPLRETFGDVAVELGFVTPSQHHKALDIQGSSGKDIAEILIEQGALTPEQAAAVRREEARRRSARTRMVGPYEIIQKIGAGGMGAVYEARDTRTGKHVALKILPPSLASDSRYLERFLREAELASKLDHENIVKGYGAGESNGLYYFAMEYVVGENVQEMLSRVGRFPEETALKIVLPVARALQHAHFHGLVHQDVKPENIIIDRKGTVKLLDLGLARRSGDLATVRLGTPLYVSPEQIRGDRPVDIRSDIYSLGATLYHMVTGCPPYIGRDEKETLTQHLEDELPWPQDHVSELSEGICLVIARMLAKDPDERYREPKEVLHDLECLLDGNPPHFAIHGPRKSSVKIKHRRSEQVQPAKTTVGTNAAPTGKRAEEHKAPRHKNPQASSVALWLLMAFAAAISSAIVVYLLLSL